MGGLVGSGTHPERTALIDIFPQNPQFFFAALKLEREGKSATKSVGATISVNE